MTKKDKGLQNRRIGEMGRLRISFDTTPLEHESNKKESTTNKKSTRTGHDYTKRGAE